MPRVTAVVPQELRDRFAAELREAMARRGMDSPTLAGHVGLSRFTIHSYRVARSFPQAWGAAQMAEALDWPLLREYGSYKVICHVCDRVFEATTKGGQPRKFCSGRCQGRGRLGRMNRWRLHQAFADLRSERAVSENRRLAILHNCLECAGAGRVCPMIPRCPFIPVTELPKRSARATSDVRQAP